MRIYIGASFTSRERLRPIRDALWARGYEVVSSWLDEVAKPANMTQQEFYKKLAIKDLCELKAADLAIIDLIDPSTSGGRDTELGFALGSFASKQIYTVGKVTSVFHELVDKQFPDWDAALLSLPSIEQAKLAETKAGTANSCSWNYANQFPTTKMKVI